MSDPVVPEARDGAAPTEEAPQYGPLGLNHTLRIEGRAYFYDPELGLWERGSGPAGTEGMPLHANADSIHTWMQQGYRVLPWTEDAR